MKAIGPQFVSATGKKRKREGLARQNCGQLANNGNWPKDCLSNWHKDKNSRQLAQTR